MDLGHQKSVENLQRELELAQAAGAWVGVGFIAWLKDSEKLLHWLLSEQRLNVPAVWFAFGDEVKRLVEITQEYNERVDSPTLIFIQVGDVEAAKDH